MRKLALILGLMVPALLSAQVGVMASRRYAELTPEQYKFGPLKAVAPFNNTPNWNLVSSLGQIQAAWAPYASSNFASTSDFTAYTPGTPCTFSVASNIGTLACGGSSAESDLKINGATLTAPTMFVSMTFQTNGTAGAGSFDNAGLHLMKDAGNMVGYEVDHRNNLVVYDHVISGSRGTATTGFTIPSAPWQFGVSLVNNFMCAWANSGSGWKTIRCDDVTSIYNFTTSGNLTGWAPGFDARSANASTWTFKLFASGAFGAANVCDISLVTYADGRPYIKGTVAYFTASVRHPLDTNFNGSYDGVFSYDLSSGTLSQIGGMFNSRSGIVIGDSASHLVYDPALDEYRYMIGGWGTYNGTSTFPPTYYTSWARTTFDPLAGGLGVVTASTVMSFNNPAWDSHFACSQWNYSTGSCSKWIVTFAKFPAEVMAQYSTSDPSVNTWTSIGFDNPTVSGLLEGNRVLRTATGSSGVNYEFAVGGISSSGSSAENRIFNTYNQSSFGALAGLNAQMPSGGFNAPHPQIFSYGNTEYLMTFDGNLYKINASTMGNWLIATAPKYSAQTNWPKFAIGTDTAASGASATITSPAITVTAGDIAVVYCTGNDNGVTTTSVAVSSTPSQGTWISAGFEHTNPVYDGASYILGISSTASTTFTCTPSGTKTFQSITVMTFHPGFVTTTDTIAMNGFTASIVPFVSTSFSTTAKGLIVVCAVPEFNATYIQPGFIGPYKSSITYGIFGSFQGACESTVTEAAQSSITASMGVTSTNTGIWGGAILSFK